MEKQVEDYYKTLGLQRGVTSDEIKKAYRQLAMRWHPDKNLGNSQEAHDKFKAISEAYQVLSDEDKRREYDMCGFNKEDHSPKLTPEDLYNMFFGPHAQRNASKRQYEVSHSYAGLIVLLALVLYSIYSKYSEENLFSLTESPSFPVLRRTAVGTEYWVNHNFAWTFDVDSRAVSYVEDLVEKTHKQQLEQECNKERSKQRRLEKEAKQQLSGDELRARLHKIRSELSHCKRLEDYSAAVAAAAAS